MIHRNLGGLYELVELEGVGLSKMGMRFGVDAVYFKDDNFTYLFDEHVFKDSEPLYSLLFQFDNRKKEVFRPRKEGDSS